MTVQSEQPLRLRTLLFVPGDRPDRIPKAAAAGADGIAIDLEDAVALSRKEAARQAIAETLATLPPDGPAIACGSTPSTRASPKPTSRHSNPCSPVSTS
ncbi:hypothetical protein GCM10010464_75590 [Pseudonocardia yunnanensis]|uniref:Aldolase/citrate lyase family protein n=1 Tax=Pseudonocardia yunnanensis TaxID=58107 RepID=A0ABW4FC51_9PSEU